MVDNSKESSLKNQFSNWIFYSFNFHKQADKTRPRQRYKFSEKTFVVTLGQSSESQTQSYWRLTFFQSNIKSHQRVIRMLSSKVYSFRSVAIVRKAIIPSLLLLPRRRHLTYLHNFNKSIVEG